MSDLDRFARAHGTDKSSAGHNYTPHYERLFEPLRHSPVMLLEIGVYQGASLRMWADFFDHPNARIIGLDIAPLEVVNTDRVRTVIGDVKTWDASNVWMERPAGQCAFDIIVDDGSHFNLDIIAAFDRLWPELAPGGWYCIEDWATQFPPLERDYVRSGSRSAAESAYGWMAEILSQAPRPAGLRASKGTTLVPVAESGCRFSEMHVWPQLLAMKKN